MGECCCIHPLGNCTKMSLPLGLEQGLRNLQRWCSYAINKFCIYKCRPNILLAPVVQKLDGAIHQINRYPMDEYYEN